MMWTVLKIYLAVGLLKICVRGDLRNILGDLTKNNQLIDGIFQIGSYPIGRGGFSSVYRGVNMIDNREVAMKFTNSSQLKSSEREYEMHSYLNAINNSDVLKYGISPIYYYNPKFADDYILTVFPLFKSSLREVLRYEFEEWDTIDTLILLRDFVRQAKYVHSHGVRHDDIKPDNIMFYKGKSILIDFNIASKLNETTKYASSLYASRNRHKNLIRTTRCDLESFLYTLCEITHVPLEWFEEEHQSIINEEKHKIFGKFKENTIETIRLIEKSIKCDHLKEVMVKFAHEAFEDGSSPISYNDLEELILKKIDVINTDQPVLFQWLSYEEREEAIEELRENPSVTAKDINYDPKATVSYAPPEFDYFEKHREEMIKKASKNQHERYLREEEEKRKKDLQVARQREHEAEKRQLEEQIQSTKNKRKYIPSWLKGKKKCW